MPDLQHDPLTFLVVEDDPGDFGLVKAYLRETGLGYGTEGVAWAKTLAEGITASCRTAPDVVLLDLSLPDSSGLATVQAVRAALPYASIVVMTGNDEKTLAVAALESGAQDYLVKGRFDHDALGRAVRHAWVRGRLEQGLARSRGLYAALSQCNQAIVRCTDENELLLQVCRIVVEFAGMKMAWIGITDPLTRKICAAASFGSGAEYLQDIDISVDDDSPRGHGPTGTAIRENRPFWCQDFLHDSAAAPWHERGARFGWGASASLPLHRDAVPIGAFILYAGETNVFDEPARKLLLEMTSDISFALDNFVREGERKQTAEALRASEARMRSFFENAPVGIFLSSREGKFLYVNPAMAVILGYESCEELMEVVNRSSIAAVLYVEPLARKVIVEDLQSNPGHWRTLENRYRRKDGQIVDAMLSVGEEHDTATGEINLFGVVTDITQRKRANERIQWLSDFDALTGLANHSLLNDRFNHVASMAQLSQRMLTLITIDLDHFKNINDTLGRHIGDALLIEVARRIQAVVREEDTVSRQGGDEFVLLMPTTDVIGAALVADKLLEAIAGCYQIEAHELVITPSIGIAMYPLDGTDFDTLSKNADVAMYRAKRDGRNCYRFFAAEMQTRSIRTLQVESALRRALEGGQLSLHYQPQVSMEDGRIIGAEALLRWQHPELGMVSPAEFIPIAEASGQIVQLGEWVLRTAVRQMKTWIDSGMTSQGLVSASMVMAVNLSVVQFRHPQLVEHVMRILNEEGLPPQCLELELTEGVALSDPIGAIKVMNTLHANGIRMSIDDFGTGYSSLSYLKRFKAYKLKIDQSFVRDITVDPEDRAIVSAIINMANSLGLQTIAEGVETEGQQAFLRQGGCNEMQGYLFSKPLPVDAFEALLLPATCIA